MIKKSKITSNEIRSLFEKGKRKKGVYCQLIYHSNCLTCSRSVIIVSKKYGKAVKRNRIKRIFREIIRLESKNLIKGNDMIIMPKKETLFINFHLLKDDLIDLLKQEGLREDVV